MERRWDGLIEVMTLSCDILTWREDVRPADIQWVRDWCRTSGFFNDEEVDVAVELVQERLNKGLASGYYFLFAENGEQPLGYACYGPIAGTESGWDLYWIVVDPERRGLGLGGRLIAEVHQRVRTMKGRQVYVETSSRTLYEPTRAFYRKNGYRQVADIPDFYAAGDHKIIFVKTLD